MALQSQVNVTVRYGAESSFGTESTAGGQLLRRMSTTLTTTKDAITSNEVRPDQQVQDMRHGVRRVAGNLQGELSLLTYDDLIAAALRSTWSSDKISSGTLTPSFTFEHYYPDLDVSEVFTGCRVGEMAVSLPPTGMASITFGVQGKDGFLRTGAQAPKFSNPAASTITGTMAGANGSLTIDGVASAIVTGLDFTVNNSLNSSPVVGANVVPEIFYGRQIVTGNISAYLESGGLVDKFLSEAEVGIVMQLNSSGGDHYKFTFQRVKLTGVSKTIGPDGGVICSFPFQSLYNPATSSAGAGSIAIERYDAAPLNA